jgi:hypothetical protein
MMVIALSVGLNARSLENTLMMGAQKQFARS